MIDNQQLKETALACQADGAGLVEVAKITFRPEFRDLCAANSCGNFGKCWMCPPDVGDINDLIARASSRKTGLVFQTIGQLRNSYDYRGMVSAAKHHGQVTLAVAGELRPRLPNPLILGAGICPVCPDCAQKDGLPCRFPDQAIASLEAHGVAVSELAGLCGLKYINGQNTVTYFSAILFD